MEDLSTSTISRYRKSGSTSSAMSGLTSDNGKSAETSDSTEEEMNGKLVVVAVPITFMGDVIGAVFMAQSMTEIMDGMRR